MFGSEWLGVASAVLTLLILVFSEIIPKTLGAVYWRQLAPAVAWLLHGLVIALYPFVKLSGLLTSRLDTAPTLRGFSRHEFRVMAELGEREGELEARERQILKNLLRLRELKVEFAMTPRTVMYTADGGQSVADYFAAHGREPFSRVPLHDGDRERIAGFLLRVDLLQAMANGEGQRPLTDFRRELLTIPDSISLLQAYDQLIEQRAHISLIVNEYGTVRGLLTLEDVLETLLGLDIVDEGDRQGSMQRHARRLWEQRARNMGLEIEDAE